MNTFLLSSAFMASPIQKADKTDKKAENDKEADALKVKPSSIPLYPEPEK